MLSRSGSIAPERACYRTGLRPDCLTRSNAFPFRSRLITITRHPRMRSPEIVATPGDTDQVPALRLATEADLSELLRWRNDPKTRHFRNDPRLIKSDEHAAWLKRRQQSESRVYIYEYAGQPVGNITLDVSERGYELGWIIAPECRGHGVGKAMVMAAIAMMPVDRSIWCKMREDNVASSRLAVSCGFLPCGRDGAMLFLELPPRIQKSGSSKA
jgi:RimJ/RimL family protein N-acetyltransferase